jgi:integrase/recombinase XerC
MFELQVISAGASGTSEVFLRDLVSDLLSNKRSENTKRAYRNDLNEFFITMTGESASQGRINQFLSLNRFDAINVGLKYKGIMIERGLAEATINRRLAAVRSLAKYAKMIGLCQWDLSDLQGERISPHRDTSGISVQQMNDMLKIPNRETVKGKRDYALLRVFWELALRRGEVTKMNIEDFDPETCTISILGKGKGTQKESMTITEKTRDAVQEWLRTREELTPKEPLFVSVDRAHAGHRITGEGLAKFVKSMSKKAGITKKMSPHRLRHTAITAALEATNGDVRRVQKLSRHAKIETVMIYDDNRVNQQKQVTDLLAGLA